MKSVASRLGHSLGNGSIEGRLQKGRGGQSKGNSAFKSTKGKLTNLNTLLTNCLIGLRPFACYPNSRTPALSNAPVLVLSLSFSNYILKFIKN